MPLSWVNRVDADAAPTIRRIVSRNPNTLKPSDNAAMDILMNGERRTFATPSLSVADLLQAEGLATRRVAVEVNGEIVPRGRHADHALQAGDRVEIVHALGGG
jgi:sulfur carrier protein